LNLIKTTDSLTVGLLEHVLFQMCFFVFNITLLIYIFTLILASVFIKY